MKFDIKQEGRKNDRGKSIMRYLNSPAIMASGTSNTIFLPSDTDDLCDRIILMLQEKHARNHAGLINKEVFAILDKLLGYKCLYKKQHKQTFFQM